MLTLLPDTSNPSVFAPAGLPPLLAFGLSPSAAQRTSGIKARHSDSNRKEDAQLSTVTPVSVIAAEFEMAKARAGEFTTLTF